MRIDPLDSKRITVNLNFLRLVVNTKTSIVQMGPNILYVG